MKKGSLLVIGLVIGMTSFGQTKVKFKINHLLENEAFALNKTAQNDMSNQFNVTRLEYYISGISIVHDGGQVADASDVYILVNASNDEVYDLGDHNITTVEAINFSIGVDPGVNNGDPAQWPPMHALSPKSPSMHWGWTAGYRFVAMEGKAGASLTTEYQLHGLGNENYFAINIPTGAQNDTGDLLIELNADYTEALSGIAVSNGVIVHGGYDEALTMLRNFNSKVFTSLSGEGNTLGTNDIDAAGLFTISPNPAVSEVTLRTEDSRFNGSILTITDMTGREVIEPLHLTSGTLHLNLERSGIYFATLVTKEGLRTTKKLVVQ